MLQSLIFFFSAFFWLSLVKKARLVFISHRMDKEAEAKEKGCWAVPRVTQGASGRYGWHRHVF